MDISGISAGIGTYLTFFFSFCVRYFVVLGGIYWLLHIGFREKWMARRIQPGFPALPAVAQEIRWSMANGSFTAFSALLFYELVHGGHTLMYLRVSDHGWLYFIATIVFGIVGYETYNYWGHRLLHTPWMFRHVHWAHHVTNPSVFSSFARHPVEAVIEQAYYFLWILLVPTHPAALMIVMLFFFYNGVIAHTGYEFYPRLFSAVPLVRWLNTATFHNMHHHAESCNYGTATTVWDWWMGTSHPGYPASFEAMTARVRTSPAIHVSAVSAEVGRQGVTGPVA